MSREDYNLPFLSRHQLKNSYVRVMLEGNHEKLTNLCTRLAVRILARQRPYHKAGYIDKAHIRANNNLGRSRL